MNTKTEKDKFSFFIAEAEQILAQLAFKHQITECELVSQYKKMLGIVSVKNNPTNGITESYARILDIATKKDYFEYQLEKFKTKSKKEVNKKQI